jgi:tyrosyl-tRNA synthetase
MSKTISFVASDELAEYLEEESERRMTTVSSTAQMLLAEKYRAEQGGAEAAKPASEPSKDVFDRNPDAWYHPNSQKHDYAVNVPDDAGVHDEGKTRYFKTRGGARKAIKRWYE